MTPTPISGPGRSRIALAIAANIGGRVWSSLLGLALVPLYIRLLGIEAFGLIGFYTTLQAVFGIFDLGLRTTLSRELAQRSVQPGSAASMRDLTRTLECVYWGVAALIGIAVMTLAPLIAGSWVQAQQLSRTSVQQAVLLMGLTLALQFPFDLYAGGLLGLERQVLLNGMTTLMATVRGFGALAVLYIIGAQIQYFFAWQIIISGLQTALCAALLWRSLPRGGRPRFQLALLIDIWRFAAGMAGISLLSLLLMQLDKVLLSRLLPLAEFGYYNLASTLSSGLLVVIGSLFTAIFPRLSQLVALGDTQELAALYHRGCQIMAVLLLPPALVAALFAPELLLLWTNDALVVDRAHLLVSLLLIGTALNGLNTIPYALQVASGWTKLPFYQNLIAVVLFVPLLLWAVAAMGAVGAAIGWIGINAGYVLIGVPVMHTRLLPREQWRWYRQDVLLPLAATLSVALTARLLWPTGLPKLALIVLLGVVGIATLTAAALSVPATIPWLRIFSRKLRAARNSNVA
jgi:O-antigen/teichoic acid export membrane protein